MKGSCPILSASLNRQELNKELGSCSAGSTFTKIVEAKLLLEFLELGRVRDTRQYLVICDEEGCCRGP